tara:strand:+ start:415 stop:594 length:180 start_codon:yes stop_codon:yes gene_type:complete
VVKMVISHLVEIEIITVVEVEPMVEAVEDYQTWLIMVIILFLDQVAEVLSLLDMQHLHN